MKYKSRGAKIIRDARRKKEYSLEFMGEKLGIHRETYRKCEVDPGNSPANRIIDILDILEIAIIDFYHAVKLDNMSKMTE